MQSADQTVTEQMGLDTEKCSMIEAYWPSFLV